MTYNNKNIFAHKRMNDLGQVNFNDCKFMKAHLRHVQSKLSLMIMERDDRKTCNLCRNFKSDSHKVMVEKNTKLSKNNPIRKLRITRVIQPLPLFLYDVQRLSNEMIALKQRKDLLINVYFVWRGYRFVKLIRPYILKNCNWNTFFTRTVVWIQIRTANALVFKWRLIKIFQTR